MNTCSFTVQGIPTPKGSTTRMPNGVHVPAGTPASRKRMTQWRQDIRNAALVAMAKEPPMAGGIRLMVEFRMPVPQGIPKYKTGWLPHTKKPDVDKLFRMLSDALTGIVWKDDSQVCFSSINKVYAWDGRTGAMVIAEAVTDESAKRFAQTAGALREILHGEPGWVDAP